MKHVFTSPQRHLAPALLGLAAHTVIATEAWTQHQPAHVLQQYASDGLAVEAIGRQRQPLPVVSGERWIVHFKEGALDLSPLRQAIHARAPATMAKQVVTDLERQMRALQAPFVASVEKLGGRVHAQWWIVNACAVEIGAAQVAQLRAMPAVLRLERDETTRPADAKGGNRYNHNVAAVHQAGLSGAGAVVAIIDGGHDDVMGASDRPHRVYFRGGDPGNTTGPGIGGSRLLFNKQLGAMPAGAVAFHGTFVSSVAAGGGWGTTGSVPGVAFSADIAGYAIANFPNNNSSHSAQTSAWQEVLIDRATLPILVANMSYSGDPDPLGASQQALDQAARLGDIFIATCVGNDGPGGTFRSVSTVNGLAITAVRPDFHDLLGYSTRGPILGDVQRFYPDLAACIHPFVPIADCEANDDTFDGTSCASPQVAGVATVLRAAVPALTAVETKAILLASALDIAAANPGSDRNGYGMGLLRADTALATAQDASRVRSATLTTSTPTWTFPIDVTRGDPYGVAIAWHRQVTTSTAWSNLDLRILDGTTVIASSATPRNLYEMARFVAPRGGRLWAEVTGLSLELGQQPFAIAVARGISPPLVAGTFSGFGNSCAGSVGAGHTVGGGFNVLAKPDQIAAPEELGGNYEVGFIVTPPNSTAITGIEYLLGVSAPVTAQFSVYDTDSHKEPTGPPLQTATLVMAPQVAWQRWMFTPPFVPANNGRAIVIGIRSDSRHVTPQLPGGAGVPTRVRFQCSSSWAITSDFPLGLRLLCAGAGPGVDPILWNQGVPEVGRSFEARLSRAVPSGSAVLLLGTSRDQRGGVPLPIDLTSAGAPGCSLLVSDDGPPWNPGGSTIATAIDAQGEAAVVLAIPSSPGLLGANFYCQFLVMDPAANGLGVATSRGGAARIGTP